ncbi:hypothetical protein SAMN02910453_2185 [Lachnospiraceae bacterium A10]|jgi:hypothetical protein|nr:hypothetical protein SAMN02910453_2185 [Lachnospiraceae bacterium A10]
MSLKDDLKREKEKLERAYQIASRRLEDVPTGTLQCSVSKKHIDFFHCEEINHKLEKRYLRRDERELICALAQKEYDLKIQKITGKQLKLLYKLERSMENASLEDLLQELHPAKRGIVVPVELTSEEKLKIWYEKEYIRKEIAINDPKFQTKKGEYVRSKSEKILADCFYDHGILYKYECPLLLNNGWIIYPDFTFYNPEKEQEIYWEHDGMMDDDNYLKSALKKMDSYIKNDIYPGDRLILTFESRSVPMDSVVVEKLISKYLLS